MVSVIIPVYNAERYLKQCIDSVIDQDVEIIAIDNHSSDNSLEILNSYGNRITVIAQPETHTQARSMNIGLELAKGEYIAELDADDYSVNMYEPMEAMADGADVVQCGFMEIAGNMLPRRRLCLVSANEFCPMQLEKDNRFRFLQWQPHLQSAIYRKQFIIDNQILWREQGIYEDLSLSFKIRTLAKRYKQIDNAPYFYRRDNPLSGTLTDHRAFGLFEQYREIERIDMLNNLNLHKEIATMRFYSYLWGGTRQMSPGDKALYWAQAKNDFIRDDIDGGFFYRNDYETYRKIRGY